jgi:Lon protease-like protein
VQSAPYRTARIQTLDENPLPPTPQRHEHLQRLVRLYAALSQLVGEDPAPMFFPNRPQEFDEKINTLAMSLRVPPPMRQELLEAPGPAERALRLEGLLLRLVERLAAQRRFERLKSRRRTH